MVFYTVIYSHWIQVERSSQPARGESRFNSQSLDSKNVTKGLQQLYFSIHLMNEFKTMQNTNDEY